MTGKTLNRGFLNVEKAIPECVAEAMVQINKSQHELTAAKQILRHGTSDIATNYSTKTELATVKNQLTAEVNVAVQALPVGTILPMASLPKAVADSFVSCDGAQLSRATYAALFRQIGDTWGPGDGSTTFSVPDLRGRALIGVAAHHSTGQMGGEEKNMLISDALPAHTHSYVQGSGLYSYPQYAAANTGSNPAWSAVQAAMSHDVSQQIAHENMQPYAAVQFYIKVIASSHPSSRAFESGNAAFI